MTKLIMPNTVGLQPEVELLPTELKITDGCLVQFWAYTTTLPPGPATLDGLRIRPSVTRYHSRIDTENAGPVAGQECVGFAPAFHGCLRATAVLLAIYHKNVHKLEGTNQALFRERAILQGFATMYGVDVNLMAGEYATAVKWLHHERLTHPQTLESLVNGIREKQKGKLI